MDVSLPTGSQFVYTIGHSNHAPNVLLKLLQDYRIEVLVDTRSQPTSKWVTHATPKGFRELLRGTGIRYLPMGDTLGGRPADRDCYDPVTEKPDYQIIQEKEFFRRGIARLLDGMTRFRVCLMCTEEDPARCHRSMLIADALEKANVAVLHIRGDGTMERDADRLAPLRAASAKQLAFAFEDRA